ncbi:MAG TPA: hypothetical protein VKE74_34625 [Gemmataceae bacterium]|nr:hypothetical protein [Gemmataceae bacterium]
MFLVGSRPLRTYFTESPLGWYLYRWEVATTSAYIEWKEAANFAFLGVHLLVVLAVVGFVLRAAARRPR